MPLTRQDLEAIRKIVREEIDRARIDRPPMPPPSPAVRLQWARLRALSGHPPAIAALAELERELLPEQEAAKEVMERAALAACRSNTTVADSQRARELEASYYARYDEALQQRAQRLYRKAPGEPITVAEMNDALDRWRPTRRRRYEPIDEAALREQARKAADRMRAARPKPED